MKNVTTLKIPHKYYRALVRVDFNISLTNRPTEYDVFRINTALPTINYLLKQGLTVILLTHLGRPRGKIVSQLSLRSLINLLEIYIKKRIFFFDRIDFDLQKSLQNVPNGSIVLLENTRFYPQEETNDENWVKFLASLGDLFVFEGFSVAHRKHASTVGLAKLLPTYVGHHFYQEINTINRLLYSSVSPLLLILGGNKIADKIILLESWLDKADVIFLGGIFANIFLALENISYGNAFINKKDLAILKKLKIHLKSYKNKINIAQDYVIYDSKSKSTKIVALKSISNTMVISDIGDQTRHYLKKLTQQARTIIWSGPLGIYEQPEYALGSQALAKFISESPANSIIGGGDTISAAGHFLASSSNIHLTTGGGSLTYYLKNKTFPIIEVLKEKQRNNYYEI